MPGYPLVLIRVLLLSLGEPGEERVGRLVDLARDLGVDVLLGSLLAAPLGEGLLRDQVVLVVQLEDLDDLVVDVRMLFGDLGDESLRATQDRLLVALRGDDLRVG